MTQPTLATSLLDVGGTLFDNEGIVANLTRHLTPGFATGRASR